MTDREKLTAIVEAVCEKYRETSRSLIIYDSMIKIIFEDNGEIRSVIRDHVSYGEDGRKGHTVGSNLNDGGA